MVRAVVVAALASLLVLIGIGDVSAMESGAIPTLRLPNPTMVLWQPGESFQGGAQSDARLDAPVRFWGAGRPLQDIFTELTSQTGVILGFADSQKDEPRLCLTLYLDPQHPPALRDVMAQLSWATGCAFGLTESEGGTKRYILLWSSASQGAAAQAAERQERSRAQWQAHWEAQGRSAAAVLEEAKAALALPREEAIARYRGTNDALLLNVLDPARRGGLGFLATLPEADAKELRESERRGLTREWGAWSPDQQATLTETLGLQGKLPRKGSVSVSVDIGFGGTVTAFAGEGRDRVVLGSLWGLLGAGRVWGEQEIALRRFLGELATPEQEDAARSQQREAWQAQATDWQQQWARRQEQAQAAARALSSACESRLASLTLPEVTPESDLWQLQEAVAKATGLHVVADCFWPPRLVFPGRVTETASAGTSALEALSRACADVTAGFGLGLGGGEGDDLGAQWGDAGAFLRFRARRPDIWRGAMLPETARAQLDAWLEPFIAPATAGPDETPLAGDLEKLSWLAGQLSDLQVRLGAAMPYEDPSDPQLARRQKLRRFTLERMAMSLPALRLMATFTLKQWQLVRTQGLRWGYDLTPDQQSSGTLRIAIREVPEGQAREVVVQLAKSEERSFTPPGGPAVTLPSVAALRLTLNGRLVNEVLLEPPWRGPWGGGARR